MPEDIRIHVGFKDHIKTKKLRKRLGWEGLGALIYLWLSARESKPRGDLSGLSAEDIAMMAEWEGDPQRFVDVLVEIGWLDKDEQGNIKLHDWETWNRFAYYSEERSEAARQSVACRHDRKNKATKRKRNVYETYTDRIQNANETSTNLSTPSPLPLPLPSPTRSDPPVGGQGGKDQKAESQTAEAKQPNTKKFIPPTADEVRAYAGSIGFEALNPEGFIASYEQKGWRVGRAATPMKDWKAAVRLWKQNAYDRGELPTTDPEPKQAADSNGRPHTAAEFAQILSPFSRKTPKELKAYAPDNIVATLKYRHAYRPAFDDILAFSTFAYDFSSLCAALEKADAAQAAAANA
jgi:hypothetical protein